MDEEESLVIERTPNTSCYTLVVDAEQRLHLAGLLGSGYLSCLTIVTLGSTIHRLIEPAAVEKLLKLPELAVSIDQLGLFCRPDRTLAS